MYSLEVAICVHEISEHGSLQQCRDALSLDFNLRHKMPIRTVLSASKRDRLGGRFPGGKALSVAGKSE